MNVTDSIIKVAGYCVAFISQQKLCSFDIFLLFKKYFFLGILEWWSFSHCFDFVIYLFLETISLIVFCLSGLELSVYTRLDSNLEKSASLYLSIKGVYYHPGPTLLQFLFFFFFLARFLKTMYGELFFFDSISICWY